MQLKNLDGIAGNFRIKKVYVQNNQLTNLDGIKKFKFLDTLLASHNRLKDLDKYLLYLAKFSFLEYLDLFGNPLAEEPDYRLKVIYTLPHVKVLDRHRKSKHPRFNCVLI